MRTYTFVFSILVHLTIVGVLIVSPLVANNVLPAPRRAVEFIDAHAIPSASIPSPPRRGRRSSSNISRPTAAPVVSPPDIVPDTGLDPFEIEGGTEGVPGGSSDGVPGSMIPERPEPPPPPPPKTTAPIPVGGAIRQPQKTRHVAPVYPALALAARKEGTVIVEAVIGEDGRVRDVRVLRSIPLLDEAAIEAVRQWQFTPTMLNDQPVPVVMTVTVTFTLQR
jgi:periplasmic protein TonB